MDFQLFTLNCSHPSAAHNSECQLIDQVAGCHRDQSFVCYLQLTAKQALDEHKPLFNKSHLFFSFLISHSAKGWSLAAGLCTVQAFSSTRSLSLVALCFKEHGHDAAHVTVCWLFWGKFD